MFLSFGRKFSVGTGLNVVSENANQDSLASEETASISVPPSSPNLLPNNTENISLIFTVYSETGLFPVRSDDTNRTSEQVVGSQIVSFSVPGIQPGTKLPNPVNITLRLENPKTGNIEVSLL